MIGWRGEPGKIDEPQHKKMGRITLPLLETLEIPYEIFPDTDTELEIVLGKAKNYIKENNSPFALVIKKKTLEPYNSKKKKNLHYSQMSREDAIKVIIANSSGKEVIISTTGKTSRELFETRVSRKEEPRDFYTVGSMGCASAIGLGVALNSKAKTLVIDGDGALIMQMGTLATIGHYQPGNFYHILFDNNAHDSTGGQPTVSDTIDFEKICVGNGYKSVSSVSDEENLKIKLNEMFLKPGPSMLIIKVKKGARDNLGRPTTSPIENKHSFMNFLQKLNGK
jgi:phosphonopyruvate decarboxylase